MRRRSGGFLLVELIVGLSLFCGVMLMLLLAVGSAGEVVAVNMERATAAGRIDRILEEVRRGIIEVRKEGSTTLPPPGQEAALPGEKCTIEVEPWAKAPALRKVSITVSWQSRRRRETSMSAGTLVRTGRLKFAGAER